MYLILTLVFLFGLCLGSFVNVIIYRLPRNISIFKPGSFCPNCKTSIKWFDNIPLLSYFILNRKCRYCNAKISVQYPVVEFLTAILLLIVFIKFHSKIQLLALYSVFTFLLLVISVIDLQHSIIPNCLSLQLILIGLVFSPFNTFLDSLYHFTFATYRLSLIAYRLLSALAGAIFGFLLMLFIAVVGKKIFKKEALGGGDIKLAAGLGAYLGIEKLPIALFLGSLVGTLSALILIYILKKKSWGSYLPFGPFLATGALLTVVIFF